jgi:hypothetical protein
MPYCLASFQDKIEEVGEDLAKINEISHVTKEIVRQLAPLTFLQWFIPKVRKTSNAL